MPKAYFTVGCSASGKSTWAEELVQKNRGKVVRFERDQIRALILFGRNGAYHPSDLWVEWNFKEEKLVDSTMAEAQAGFVAKGVDIIFSDTWLNQDRLYAKIKEMQALGYTYEVKYFPVDDIDVLIKRDKARHNSVGESVIRKQWKQWLELGTEITGIKKYIPDYSTRARKRTCIVVDIDGTVANMNGKRGPFEWDKVGLDDPRDEICRIVEMVWSRGFQVVFLSGRDSVCREDTVSWIRKNIRIDGDFLLYMRKEGDMRKDRIIKDELFWEHVAPGYNVMFAIDDRKQMVQYWTDIGVPLLNVGNVYDDF